MAVPTLALKSALVGFVLYTAYAGTMRTRESALSYRLSRFYEAHGIAKRQPDTRKLLHRHGSVEGVERELRKKYGDWLPPEDLSVLPLADDTVGTAVYLLSGALADRAPPWLSQLSDADWKRLPGAGLVQRWEAAPTAARLGYSAVGCSALRLALPESMRLPAILAFGALAWSVRPTPEELSPISLWRELVAAWDGGASAPEEPRALPRRLAICSGVALVVAAAAGPSHSLPVLLALLLAALCVSVPETADTWESMPIVAPSARSALRSALKQKPDLLQQHEAGRSETPPRSSCTPSGPTRARALALRWACSRMSPSMPSTRAGRRRSSQSARSAAGCRWARSLPPALRTARESLRCLAGCSRPPPFPPPSFCSPALPPLSTAMGTSPCLRGPRARRCCSSRWPASSRPPPRGCSRDVARRTRAIYLRAKVAAALFSAASFASRSSTRDDSLRGVCRSPLAHLDWPLARAFFLVRLC